VYSGNMMNNFLRLCTPLAILACIVGCSKLEETRQRPGISAGKVLATVDKVKITEGELEFLAKIGPPRFQAQLQTPEGRQRLINDIIDRELLYAEAVKKGLHRDADVVAQIDMNSRILVASAALRKEIETQAEAYFTEHSAEFTTLDLHHILIRTGKPGAGGAKKKTARTDKAALQRITKTKERIINGEGFRDVCMEVSEDPSTRRIGGSLGTVWQEEPRLLRRGYGDLLATAFTMPVATVNGPLKTDEGYHLLFIPEAAKHQTFEEVKQKVEFQVRGDVRTTYLAALRAQANVEVKIGAPQAPPVDPAAPETDDHSSHNH
jgi:peptidyl-prolyl cis-trans isomerase C